MHETDMLPASPKFPIIIPTPTTTVLFSTAPRILRRTKSVVIVSDMRVGYMQDGQSTHDDLSINIAQQIVADVSPAEVIFMGPLTSPQTERPVLQRMIDLVHEICGRFVSAAGPRAKVSVISSPLDVHVQESVIAWNKQALCAESYPQVPWPVFSVAYLARLEDLGIIVRSVGEAEPYNILDDLVVLNAPPECKDLSSSVVHGRTHRNQRDTFVQRHPHGRRIRYVADVGCLCSTESTDWVQGIAIVNIVEHTDGPLSTIDLVEIVSTSADERKAIYGGQVYSSLAETTLEQQAAA